LVLKHRLSNSGLAQKLADEKRKRTGTAAIKFYAERRTISASRQWTAILVAGMVGIYVHVDSGTPALGETFFLTTNYPCIFSKLI